ncbi:putative yir4 protein, partial [Plasmodium yoelii yoelii]
MDDKICKKFQDVRNPLPDYLHSNGIYKFSDAEILNKHCYGNTCYSDYDRLNAGFLYFFNEFFGNLNSFNDNQKKNTDIVDYIIIWLSYMLNLKKNEEPDVIKNFYNNYINSSHKYNNGTNDASDYEIYKGIIDKKNDLLYMDSNNVSKFYEAFKSLCEMYSEFGGNKSNCKKCSENANQFVEKYKELNGDSNNNDRSPYKKILSTLSNDYDNLKNECKDAQDSKFPALTEINTLQDAIESAGHTTEQTGETVKKSDVTSSSSSIVSKLIPVVSIFAAISIFLGISYKVNNDFYVVGQDSGFMKPIFG